jgi:hypothetical protein
MDITEVDLAEDNEMLSASQRQDISKALRDSGDKSPSVRLQSEAYKFYQQSLERLGTPYDVTRIPLSVLAQMERDPMIRFGLHFHRTPIMRANWYIKCEDAQVAAFVDGALRRILPRLFWQYSMSWTYGFKPIVKRFGLDIPNWTYVDPAKSDEELKVWDNGNVEAVVWKSFVGLPSDPTIAEPKFKESGEFNGILYNKGGTMFPFANQGERGEQNIPVSHSLWVTNERDSVNGSLWGYPLIGYAYRYWWSSWFRWALYDRFFERKADPPILAYYPQGTPDGDFSEDEDGEKVSMKAIALNLAEAAKSGGAIAMPGNTIMGYDDRPTSIREWEIKELELKGDVSHFVESFEYLDVMKLRSLVIPEQAFLEGKGGTSSRNVASEEIGVHKEGTAVLSDELDDMINRWVIPDLIAANFPDRQVSAEKITTGFAEADQAVMQEALRTLGQTDQGALQMIDVRELMERLGLPLVSHAEIRRREEKAKEALEQSTPQPLDAEIDAAGVTETGLYYQPREVIDLSDDSSFISSLPKTKHFAHKDILSDARKLRGIWNKAYSEVYNDFADYLEKQDEIQLAEDTVSKWKPTKKFIDGVVKQSKSLIKNVIGRAGTLELRRAKLDADWKVNNEEVAAWLADRGGYMVDSITESVRADLRQYLSESVAEGQSIEEIAQGIREHFTEWPDWKADRLARTEVTNAYNFATLVAGSQKGVKIVQALDGQTGPTDEECEKRDRQFFDIPQAIEITASEHPNNTLEWRLTKRANLSVKKVSEVPAELEEAIATFDDENDTIYLSDNISEELEREYLDQIGYFLENE